MNEQLAKRCAEKNKKLGTNYQYIYFVRKIPIIINTKKMRNKKQNLKQFQL